MRSGWLLGLAAVASAQLTAGAASADLAPPGTGCSQKRLGDGCTAGWKNRESGQWRSRQAPGRCVDEVRVAGAETYHSIECRPLAAAGALLSDQACAGKADGQACEDFTLDPQGSDGACSPRTHPVHGTILGCDLGRKPASAPSASTAVAPSAPSAVAARPPAASKGCGCAVPGGEPTAGVGMAILGLLAMGVEASDEGPETSREGVSGGSGRDGDERGSRGGRAVYGKSGFLERRREEERVTRRRPPLSPPCAARGGALANRLANRTPCEQPSGVWRLASGVWRLACGVRRPASGVRRAASGVWRSASGVWRPAFGVRRLASGVWRLASGVRRPASAVRRLASGVRRRHGEGEATGAARPEMLPPLQRKGGKGGACDA